MQFYKLFNSGTSEGVAKSWEARRARAEQYSKTAEDVSEEHKDGSGDKEEIAMLHRNAARAHQEAADTVGESGLTGEALDSAKAYHEKQAKNHMGSSNFYRINQD